MSKAIMLQYLASGYYPIYIDDELSQRLRYMLYRFAI